MTNGTEWRQLRRQILDQDEYECQRCGSSDPPFEVHHIQPVSEGGEDTGENLTTLCTDCHIREHGGATGPDSLGDTDHEILAVLEDGRETTKSLADQVEKHPQTVRDRLKWLREWGYVRYHHEPTGLHDIADE